MRTMHVIDYGQYSETPIDPLYFENCYMVTTTASAQINPSKEEKKYWAIIEIMNQPFFK